MREIPHLRPRANTFYAIFRLRSFLSMAIHEFFQTQGFVYVHTPIITGNDGEGAGEMFRATTIDNTEFDKDFFGKEAFLTVTGQLHVEAFVWHLEMFIHLDQHLERKIQILQDMLVNFG